MNYIIILALLIAPAHAFGQSLSPSAFVKRAQGTYRVLQGQPAQCPVEFKAVVKANDTLVLAQPGNQYAKHFYDIGRRFRRLNDDGGTYRDSRTILRGAVAIAQTRSCAGFVLIECSDWVWHSSFALTETGAVVSVNPRGERFDYAGFPLATCEYRKID